jgi:O-antigen ligase
LAEKPTAILEKVFVFFALQLFSGAIIQVTKKVSGAAPVDVSTGDPVMQVIWFGIYGIAFLLIFRQWKKLIYVATRDKLLLLLVIIALISAFWSTDPQVTLRRGVALVGTTFFGVYLATRYSPRELVRLLAWIFSIGALLSLVFCLVFPAYGIQGYKGLGVWRGIYRHKNFLGRLMVLNTLLLLLLAPGNRRYRWAFWAGIGLSVGLLLLSASKGALVVFVVLLTLLPLYRTLRWNNLSAVSLLIIAAVLMGGTIAMWIFDNLEPLLDSMGKDLTLSGRTDLWAAVIVKIKEHPLLGYGYSGFWLGWDSEAGDVWKVLPWTPPHAHNGFLDLWLDLGFLGELVFVLGFLMSFVRALRWLRSTKAVEAILVLEYLTYIFIVNQSENVILGQNDVFWVLYVALVLSIPDLRQHNSLMGQADIKTQNTKDPCLDPVS